MNPQPLHLRERQIPHTIRCVEALARSHVFVDTSKMGCGKTVVWCYVALYYGLPLLVVNIKNGEIAWRRETAKYGNHLYDVITYQGLRSVKGKQPKHGLLTRLDTKTDDGTDLVRFTPTNKLREMVNRGVLVVFDECQKIKNKSDQWRACEAIANLVVASGRSRLALLSGAPYDKEEHVVNLLRLGAFIRHHRLFVHHQQTNDLQLLGAQELIDACRRVNQAETDNTLNEYPLNPRNVNGLCYQLWLRVLKPSIVSAMPAPHINATQTCRNGYYNLPEDEANELSLAIADLSQATRFSETEGINAREVNWGALTKALQRSEKAKVPLMTRLTNQDLETDPFWKVLIFVNYTEPLQRLVTALDRYRPLVLDGKTSVKERRRVCELFQTNDAYRLVIANMEVGGTSIDLHDLVNDTNVGRRKRRVYFSTSSYKMLEYYQATGRTHRDGALSDTDIFFVYGKIARKETSIINALSRKGKVMRELLDEEVKADVKFPDEYPIYEEPDLPGVPSHVDNVIAVVSPVRSPSLRIVTPRASAPNTPPTTTPFSPNRILGPNTPPPTIAFTPMRLSVTTQRQAPL